MWPHLRPHSVAAVVASVRAVVVGSAEVAGVAAAEAAGVVVVEAAVVLLWRLMWWLLRWPNNVCVSIVGGGGN